jgi:hypothetical protein
VIEEQGNGRQAGFQFCQHGVYLWDEKDNIARAYRPFEDVAGHNGCENLCAPGAISFPEIDANQGIIRKPREESSGSCSALHPLPIFLSRWKFSRAPRPARLSIDIGHRGL